MKRADTMLHAGLRDGRTVRKNRLSVPASVGSAPPR